MTALGAMTSSRLPQPRLLGVQLVDLLLRSSATSPVYSLELLLDRRPLGVGLLDLQVQLGRRASPAPRPPRPSPPRSTPPAARAPRSRSGPGRRSPWRTGSRCVARYSRLSTSVSLSWSSSTFCWFAATFFCAAPLLRLRAAPACSCRPPRAACCELRLRHLVLELREPPLRVLPVAVEVVPDHPDDRQEQEQAGRREDDVQEVDVVSVPDALLFSHGQMLKKNSGIATMYFRLKIHRSSILIGSDIIIRNRNTVDVVARPRRASRSSS